ncbi:alpha/beta fold hydrolase [Terriglobus albidus]|uniref:alpha/beta fold hydrolase n=1 Tax=Terriglobus albidus TaxID=1592106 RepID=UPI0021DFF9C4|nr:alpha/beta hydrolase [Terriglobus albidus]
MMKFPYSLFAGIIFLLPLPCGAQMAPLDPVPTGEMVDLGGRRIHLNCVGTGSPTIVIESGGGSFAVEWTLVQRAVATRYRICAYDRAGYAWSEGGAVDEGIEQTVDDLHLLLQKGRIRTPVVVVCQSLGCIYARAYQRRFPEQVAGFVFVDGSHDEGISLVLHGTRTPISLLSHEDLPQAYEEYRRSLPPLKAGGASAAPFDRLPPDIQTTRHWAFMKMLDEIGWLPNSAVAAESWREEFAALRSQRLSEPHPLGDLPLVVLERSKNPDPVWHTQQVQLAALSSRGQLIRAENSGHMIHLERPDLVAEAIHRVVSQLREKH